MVKTKNVLFETYLKKFKLIVIQHKSRTQTTGFRQSTRGHIMQLNTNGVFCQLTQEWGGWFTQLGPLHRLDSHLTDKANLFIG